LQQRQIVFPPHAGHRGDEADRRSGGQLALVEQAFDEIAVADEVDLHQVWPLGDPGGRKHRVDRATHLLERGVDRSGVAQVDLQRLGDVILHRRVVHHYHLGTELGC
jgi:hypothetical protein